jgi:hypothetical protein
MPLYYFQAGLYSGSSAILRKDAAVVLDQHPLLFGARTANTSVLLGVLKYEIVVSRPRLIAYAVLGGTTFLFCLGVLIIGSITTFAGRIPETTSASVLNFFAYCRVEESGNELVPREQELQPRFRDNEPLLRQINDLSVEITATAIGPHEQDENHSRPATQERVDSEDAQADADEEAGGARDRLSGHYDDYEELDRNDRRASQERGGMEDAEAYAGNAGRGAQVQPSGHAG